MPLEKELAIAKDIARKASSIMLEYFDGEQRMESKADNSPVTIADTMINRLVIEELQKDFNDVIIGEEESTGEYGMGRRWICDPIDGTKAYTWGVPTAMFSLALAVDGVPVLGVAYDPFLDRMYEARKGSGSFCNGTKLSVSSKGIAEGYTAISSSVYKIVHKPEAVLALEQKGAQLSSFSGAVYKMCLVARGRMLGYADPKLNAHDIAASHVIVEEAGGRVTDIHGQTLDYSKPITSAILSNGVIHEDLIECYKD